MVLLLLNRKLLSKLKQVGRQEQTTKIDPQQNKIILMQIILLQIIQQMETQMKEVHFRVVLMKQVIKCK